VFKAVDFDGVIGEQLGRMRKAQPSYKALIIIALVSILGAIVSSALSVSSSSTLPEDSLFKSIPTHVSEQYQDKTLGITINEDEFRADKPVKPC
jgi:hypothetical protein